MSPISTYASKYRQYMLLISTQTGRRAWSRGLGLDTPALRERRLRPLAHHSRQLMTNIVNHELAHIPKGEKYSLQNFLRFAYNALRRKHLTLGKTRDETLKELVDKIQKAHPEFTPQYDEDYFKI